MDVPLGDEARAWVERVAGAAVTFVAPLSGAWSSAVDRIDLVGGRRVVLRRFVNEAWLAREPDVAAEEAVALEAARAVGVIAPRLVGVDPDGASAGVPSVLMTWLEGSVRLSGDLVGGLVETLAAIHAGPVDGLPAYFPWHVPGAAVPDWTESADVWARAIDLDDAGATPAEAVLLHRDFHPGNVLWCGDGVSGVVDWVAACAGPPQVDVAHCRVNLWVLWGPEVADAFLGAYRSATGRALADQVHWDRLSALDKTGGMSVDAWHEQGRTDLTLPEVRRRLDAFLHRTVTF